MTRCEGIARVPGAAQHERSEWCAADPGPFQPVTAPDQRCSVSRCTASGARAIQRREFIALLGGAAATWPLAAGAALASEASGQRGDSKMRAPDTRPEPGSSARAPQQPGGKPFRIGYLALIPGEDQTLMKALLARLNELGYREGANLVVDYRSAEGIRSDWGRWRRSLLQPSPTC